MKNQIIAVEFRNQKIQTVQKNEVVFVVLRRIVENLGLSWSSQYQKIDKLRDKFSCVDIDTTGSDGKTYVMLCIPLRKLNGWLFSINPNKVRADIRPALVAYQEECFRVLHDHFTGRKEETPRPANTKPTPRYYISLHLIDSKTGEDVVFTGTCDTIESIINGTAAKFGMRIVKMKPLPALVH